MHLHLVCVYVGAVISVVESLLVNSPARQLTVSACAKAVFWRVSEYLSGASGQVTLPCQDRCFQKPFFNAISHSEINVVKGYMGCVYDRLLH